MAKNYYDMCVNKIAKIGDVVCLRAYSHDTAYDADIQPIIDPRWKFTVADISYTHDVSCVWIAPSGEVHKYTFHALMLDFIRG